MGLISQIPRYPAGYTVEEVLRTAFAEAVWRCGSGWRNWKRQMTASTPKDILNEYDRLSNRFADRGRL